MMEMDDHVIGFIPEEKLAAFTVGKIVVGLHRNHNPYKEYYCFFSPISAFRAEMKRTEWTPSVER